ncbi:FIVAR domain-containing protein [Mycoplasma sp. 1018B]|uniref:FIVAR domain-containing protein n=1 Tax=Mycoplasma sp. 1018B TaxID=2967302 RepID=UPI00211C8359|nr:FIVAR domain-containing protein [Mycoplasma sp. 1018B]UUM19441.1 FIVAR domain-containing protein [Mycoplasma sp. 1018B]
MNNLIDNLDPTSKDFANKVNEFNNRFDELINKQKDQNAQKELNEFLKQTKYLNNAQKEDLEKEIANFNWQNQNLLKNKIILLDQAMQTYNNIQTIDTNNINYSQADLDLKQAYDKALNDQKQTIDKIKGNNLDLNQVNQAINELKNAINNLNGQIKVNKQKELIKNKINQEYQALTNAQKDKALEAINQTNDLKILNQLNDNYQNINNLMQNLRNQLKNNSSVIINNNYYDATKENRNNYDQIINKSKNLFEDLHKNNNNDLLNETLLKTNNEQFLNSLNNLNGRSNLILAKEQANIKINNLNQYSLKEKEKINRRLDNAKNIYEVQKILNELENNHNYFDTNNKYLNWLILILLWVSIILTGGLSYFVWLLVKKFNK